MYDATLKTKSAAETIVLRRANDCIDTPGRFIPPAKLFDRFWQQGELALCFGAHGTGKSVLAVQIAEALARGEPLDGLAMPRYRQRVLYVDLVNTDEQFKLRYFGPDGRVKRFSHNFHRDSPPAGEDLVAWLRKACSNRIIDAIMIDDLTALRTTFDGTRETLKVMRELRRLAHEKRTSILVLIESQPPRKGETISERDMLRSRVLCDAADSVFGIGRDQKQPEWHYIMQLRSRSGPIMWDYRHAPFVRIVRDDDGRLAMAFDDRFVPVVDAETLRSIRTVKGLKDAGRTLTAIARETGISRSRVDRLLKKWHSSMGTVVPESEIEAAPEPAPAAEEIAESIDDGTAEETDIDDGYEGIFEENDDGTGTPDGAAALKPDRPQPPGPIPRTQDEVFKLCGCTPAWDRYGVFVWIEKYDMCGKPMIFYQKNGERYKRWKTMLYGMGGETVDGPVCIRGGG